MKFRHDEELQINKINILSGIAFLAGLSESFFLYIMSTYLKESFGSGNVGVFYLIGYAIILATLLNLHKIIKKIGKSDFLFLALFFKIIVIGILLFVSPGPIGIAAVIGYIIFLNMQWVSLDMILESHSSDKMSGRIRGKFLTAMNIGIISGPFFSTMLLERYGYYGIFLTLFIFNTLIFMAEATLIGKVNHRYEGEVGVGKILRKISKRSNILRIFYISFVLDFFYALTVIYVPIRLINLGISWQEIGVILTIMLIPFVLIQYPVGALADKKLGEKEMLIGAIFLMGLSALAMYFVASKEIFIWAIVLFSSRAGAAMIEILRDSYFYKRIDAHDVDLINIFRASSPVAYILGAITSTVLLIFCPLESVFILVAIVVFSALYPAFKLEDNQV